MRPLTVCSLADKKEERFDQAAGGREEAMEYERFIKLIKERAGLARFGEAERAASAVLEVLGEHLSTEQAAGIAGQLPTHIRDAITQNNAARQFGLEEFIRLVGEREEVGIRDAENHVHAVFSVLSDAISLHEAQDAVEQLPEAIRALFSPSLKSVLSRQGPP